MILCASLTGCVIRTSAPVAQISTYLTVTVETNTVAVVIQDGLTVRWVKHRSEPGKMVVEIEGLSAQSLGALQRTPLDQDQWTEIVRVHVDPNREPSIAGVPPVQGRYEVLSDRVSFTPSFPVQPGMTYRVELHPEKLPGSSPPKSKPFAAWFQTPAPVVTPKTTVQQVYPSASTLPENLLKFYVHFSGPMSRGGIYSHIQLLDASGQAVELPFLEIDEELWNPDLTRLTLFIDPGRIKRGVKPLEEIGPALESGKRYTLAIDRNWRDADGAPLRADYRKVFDVGPPDRDPPHPQAWRIKPPSAGTREPVVLEFPDPMEHGLAQRLIWVADSGQHKMPGEVTLANEERRWSFVPAANWKTGPHQIVASAVVEDLAGNSIGRPFEVDVFEKIQSEISDETITLPFTIR
ncbi:MAG: hypothetical protein HY735_28465 [Verrucomicrobia bacterium]|nr:hypothetical protein [Verrucomicrobiota bacterium]